MKKRIAALMLALVMVVLAIGVSGCSKSDKTDWDYISEKGEIIIGITYFRPMNYKEGDKLVGFETEFAEAVCAKLGVTPKFQEINWDAKVSELNSKTIDCVWNGMTVLDDLKEKVLISNTYMRNSQIAVIRKEDAAKYTTLDSMAGAKVVAEKGSAGEKAALANEGLAKKFTAVKAQSDTFTEVKSKTADISIVDAVTAVGTISEDSSYGDLMIVPNVNMGDPEEYAIAFRKGDTETCDKVNGAIQELYKDGTLAKIAEKYGLADRLIEQK